MGFGIAGAAVAIAFVFCDCVLEDAAFGRGLRHSRHLGRRRNLLPPRIGAQRPLDILKAMHNAPRATGVHRHGPHPARDARQGVHRVLDGQREHADVPLLSRSRGRGSAGRSGVNVRRAVFAYAVVEEHGEQQALGLPFLAAGYVGREQGAWGWVGVEVGDDEGEEFGGEGVEGWHGGCAVRYRIRE